MTKPVIVTRAAKGSPLTRTELDNNFANIDNAYIGVSDGTNSGSLNLNDQLNFAASGSATVVYNPSTNTLTVGAIAGASLPSNASGFLKNDGSGNLSWASAGGGGGSSVIFFSHITQKNGSGYYLDVSTGNLLNSNNIINITNNSEFSFTQIGTFLIELYGLATSNVDASVNLINLEQGGTLDSSAREDETFNENAGQNQFMVPPMAGIATITNSNIWNPPSTYNGFGLQYYAGGAFNGNMFLKITKLS